MKSFIFVVAAATLLPISSVSFAHSFTAITSTLDSAATNATTVVLASEASDKATDVRMINRAYLPAALTR
ncbi:DUF1471 domain-containing protein [Erwinia sp. P6884]|uniref:DUF1471 domain-containing protein n=1 Tax=Erwinia sp. P6884 TaxID=3141450 RepID=UPI00319657B1